MGKEFLNPFVAGSSGLSPASFGRSIVHISSALEA
jgi:hypothetical protein